MIPVELAPLVRRIRLRIIQLIRKRYGAHKEPKEGVAWNPKQVHQAWKELENDNAERD